MSFLYRSSPTIIRSAAAASSSPVRCFSVAAVYRKTATETVKDGLKKVDRTVSDQVVKGIDAGVEAKNKAAEVAGMKASEAKGAAAETAGEAKGKAAEVKGEAKGKAEEMKGKM